MYRNLIALILVMMLFTFTYAQDAKNEAKHLTNKILDLYQKGDLEEAVKIGEKLVELESDSKNSVSYVNAAVNLARIKRAYFVSLRNKLGGNQPSSAETREMSEKANKNADDAERLFREALEINGKNGNGQTAQTADIMKDLAWLISNHTYSGTKTVDKSRSRIDEAEKLLLDSIALSEQTRGKGADETIFIVLDAGDFYFKYVNFEKALSFYERFIYAYEQKHGPNRPELVGVLRSYANILFTTLQEPESAAVVKRIESITKKNEPMPKAGIDLHLRSKDSVAYSAPIIMEVNKKAENFRNNLKAEGKTLNAANISAMPRLITVPVAVEIDETGKITKAVAKIDNDKLRTEAEAVVSKWTVRPFSYNGTTRKMRGVLYYRKSS
jgi:tetratricopeptide (TPR) repeat protein